jgi:hypothetical protein
MNIKEQICSLIEKRKLFHSEADFQFALAWEIQQSYPNAEVRLEFCPNQFPNMHIDIMVNCNGKCYPIELKYKTLKISAEIENEFYNIKNHGAQDLGRYDFLKDIERVELLRDNLNGFEKGYAIMLSNDPSYWIVKKSDKETVCDKFRIHDGIIKNGNLCWMGTPSVGTIKGREKEIVLSGEYSLLWNEYSSMSDNRNGKFKYTICEIV